MADQVLNFKFGGNSEDLERMFKRAETGFSGLEKLAETVGGAFAFDKIKEGFMSFIEESDQAELASRKLRSTMIASGQAGDPAAIEALANSLEDLSVYQGDVTVSAAAMMSRFQLSQTQIEKLLPSVQDFASYMGNDLVSSADAVAKAVAIGSTGLRQLNLGFTQAQRAAFDLADSNTRVNMIMQKINATAPGFAQAMAQTGGGAAKQFGNAVDNLKQSLGGALQQPVAAVFHTMTEAVKAATTAFDKLSPTARGVLVAAAAAATAIAAATAAFISMSGAVRMLTPLLGPAIVGFAKMMEAQVTLTGSTSSLKAAFVSMRATALTAWGGIIAPILAAAGAIVGVIAIVGVLSNVWQNNLGNIRGKVDELKETFKTLGDWVKDMFQNMVGNIVAAFSYVKNRLKGMSDDQASIAAAKAGDDATSSVSSGMKDAGDYLKSAIATGGEMLQFAGENLRDNLASGAKALGLDKLVAAFASMNKADTSKVKGSDKGPPPEAEALTLKTAFLGMSDRNMKLMDQNLAGELVRVLGGGSLKKTSQMLEKLEATSGLSEQTLTTILQKTQVGAAGLGNVANALRGTSDATVAALLKASGDDINAVMATAPAIKGLGDAAVAALLEGGTSLEQVRNVAPSLKNLSDETIQAIMATGDGIDALREVAPSIAFLGDDVVKALLKASGNTTGYLAGIAPSVAGLSADTITQFMKLGGTIEGLASLGDSMQAQQKAATNAMQAADAYWHSLKGTLESRGTELAGNLTSGMGAVGGAFTNAMASLNKGDIWGAAIGGISSIITESKSFQAISKMINEIFENFAQALNPLFDGLGPILGLVGTLMQSIGGAIAAIMKGIQPIFAVISAVLAPIFTILNSVFGVLSTTFKQIFQPLGSIIKGLMPIFKIITDLFSVMVPILMRLFTATSPLNIVLGIVAALFKALEPVFLLVSKAIGQFTNFVLGIFKSLAGVYNGVVSAIAKFVQDVVSKIPGMGDVAKDWANKIRGAQINVGQFDDAMKQVTADASNQADVVLPDLSQALTDTKDSAQGASQEIGNAPQGFKVALNEFNAQQALTTAAAQQFFSVMSKGLGGVNSTPQVVAGSTPSVASTAPAGSDPRAGGGGGTVNIYVSNPDPASLAETVQQQLAKRNMQRTGNPLIGRLRFGVATVGSSGK